MYKGLLLLTGFLCACNIMIKAQYEGTTDAVQYTMDKLIPSYLQIKEKGISSPRTTALKARHVGLERLLNLNDETNAILKDTLTDIAGGFHESCVEYYHGIEVEGTRFTIHYNKDGVPTMANGNFRTISNLQMTPAISEPTALREAIKYVRAEKYAWEDEGDYPTGRLVVYINGDNAYLAYKFAINAIIPYSHQYVYINADNGSFLGAYNADHPITSSVQTRFSGAVQIESQYYNSKYRLRDYSRGNGIETYNSSWQDYQSINSSWSTLSTFDRSALDVHWGIESTFDFYYNTFGRNSYNNNGGIIKSRVNDTSLANAYWDTDNKKMYYGFMPNLLGYPMLDYPLVSLDITAHELTHGVTGETSGLIYERESGALNEGMSDVFAVCVENEYKTDSEIWKIGEDVISNGLRDLSNPTCKYYQGVGWFNTNQTPTFSNDFCGVHDNSGVFSYWFYLISMGGSGINESGLYYPVQSIGLDNAIQICYLLNTSYLYSNATYSDAKRLSYLAAQALGYDSSVIEQMRKAWIDVGVEKPKLKIIGNSFICDYSQYYVDDLPPGYYVSWNLSNSYYNNGFNLIPSYPTTGHCRIVRNPNHDLENATLTAEIKYNGVTVKTLTKTGIYAYEGFRGHYVSGNISSDIDYTYILHVTPNYNTIITSHNFLGATVSYSSSGTTPLYWGFDPSTGEIDVTMPSNNNNIPIVLNIDDVCGNQYTLYLFPTSYNSMNVSYGDSSITLTLNENGNPETGLSLDQPWTLEVSNALTGTLMATRSSMSSRSTTISTAGWPKGMYVVRVNIGNEVLTEKVIVK